MSLYNPSYTSPPVYSYDGVPWINHDNNRQFQGINSSAANNAVSQPTLPEIYHGSQNPQVQPNLNNPLHWTINTTDYLLPAATHGPSNGGELGEPNLHVHSPHPMLECKWAGCTYTGRFARTPDLLRHIRHIHLDPQLYSCPIQPHCKRFNRKDNLVSHMRRVHGTDP